LQYAALQTAAGVLKKIFKKEKKMKIRVYYFSFKSPRSYSGIGGAPICSSVSLPDLTNNGF
jgi:hypothetical protein